MMLSEYKTIQAEWIKAWLIANDQLRRINKELYERTELFERGYEDDFDENLHNFFAKKITRFNKEHNELLKLLSNEVIEYINKEEK